MGRPRKGSAKVRFSRSQVRGVAVTVLTTLVLVCTAGTASIGVRRACSAGTAEPDLQSSDKD